MTSVAGRTTAVRAAAERRARDIRAQREAERRRHEAQIDAALADYFEASARAEQIKRDAAQRAAAMVERAEAEASEFSGNARRAIRRLRDLGQTNADISKATGLSVGAVRVAAADAESRDTPADHAHSAAAEQADDASALPAETADGPSVAEIGALRAYADSNSNRSS